MQSLQAKELKIRITELAIAQEKIEYENLKSIMIDSGWKPEELSAAIKEDILDVPFDVEDIKFRLLSKLEDNIMSSLPGPIRRSIRK